MIYALVIITFFLLAFSAYLALAKEQEELRKKVDDRLERLLRSENTKGSEELTILRRDVMAELSWFNRSLLNLRFTNNLYQLVEQADLKIQVHHLVLLCFGCASFVGFLCWAIRGSVLEAAIAAGASGLAVGLLLWRFAGITKNGTIAFTLRRGADFGLSRDTVRRGLRRLELAGLVQTRGRRGQASLVTLLSSEPEQMPEAALAEER